MLDQQELRTELAEPQIEFHVGLPKKETRAQKLHDYCYKPGFPKAADRNILNEHKASNIPPREIIFDLKHPSKEVLDAYWAIHSESYLKLMSQLQVDLPDFQANIPIALIPAKDEADLLTVVNALKKTSGGENIQIVIFHNYKGNEPSAISIQAIESIEEIQNVSVITSQVPEFSGVTLAKKILTDAVSYKLNKQNIVAPLVLTDVDMVEFSTKIIQDSLRIVNGNNNYLAVTAEDDYPQELKDEFPLFAMVDEINREMLHVQIENSDNHLTMLDGKFIMINNATLQAIGGLKPCRDNNGTLELCPYEDLQLSLDLLSAGGYPENNPLYNLTGYFGHRVVTQGMREVGNFTTDNFSQWDDIGVYYAQADTQRPETISAEAFARQPITSESAGLAVSIWWENFITHRTNRDIRDYNQYSIFLMKALERLGYDGKFKLVNLYKNPWITTVFDHKLLFDDHIVFPDLTIATSDIAHTMPLLRLNNYMVIKIDELKSNK